MSTEGKKKKPQRKGAGSIFKPKHSRFWWIAYISGGKRRFESTKSEMMTVAQKLLTQRLGDSGKGHVVTPKMFKTTLLEGLTAHVNDLKINNRKSARCTTCKKVCNIEGHTNGAWRRIELHVLPFFNGSRTMASISMDDIEAYKTHRIVTEKAAPASVNVELAALRRAFRLARKRKSLAVMPAIEMLEVNNARSGFFEHAEFDAVCSHLPLELQPVVKFAFVTGWRINEVLSLTVSNVDLDAGTVKLDVGTTKSGKGRTFMLADEELIELLRGQLQSIEVLKQTGTICPWIFHRRIDSRIKRLRGKRIKSLRAAWVSARRAAGYPTKLLHDFRRTAVRNLERASVPRSSAKKMVGHETDAIYDRYAIQDEVMLMEGSAKYSAWSKTQTAAAKQKGQVKEFKKIS